MNHSEYGEFILVCLMCRLIISLIIYLVIRQNTNLQVATCEFSEICHHLTSL